MFPVKRLAREAKIPKRANPWDAGLDLYSIEEVTLKRGEVKAVRTGIAVAIPRGFVGIIKDRSSKALKGLHCLAGVIDSGYREVEIAPALKISAFVVRKLVAQARNFSLPQLEAIHHKLVEVDSAIKTGESRGDVALEMLVTALTL